jgi:quinol monooxygenase YgiN
MNATSALGPTDESAPGAWGMAYKGVMAIMIVQGVFTVDASERDRFVETSAESMRASREEGGCLEYVMAVDPLDPERVVLSERWESMDHLEQHFARQKNSARGTESRPVPRSAEITLFEVASSRPLR